MIRHLRLLAWLFLWGLAMASGTAKADSIDPTLLGKIHEAEQGGVSVRTSVPDSVQVAKIFGVPVIEKSIQPVWLEIRNGGPDPLWYMPITTDETYFSPMEVAYRFHEEIERAEDRERDALFGKLAMPLSIQPGETASGFIFTHLETGLKFLTFGMLRDSGDLRFHFVVPVAGAPYASEDLDFGKIYAADRIETVDLPGLRAAIAKLPCCTTNAEGTKKGDPLNLVIVGDGLTTLFPFVSRGWRLTEPLDLHSAIDTAKSFLIGTHYATSPVSPLYAFGRQQDLALEKARNTINERNHLRVWLTPLRYQGQSAWIGQISRDIGVELTDKSWYLTTHKIDPDVDFDRDYLFQDLLQSGSLLHYGYAQGVGASLASDPRVNLTGDPYLTDGFRLVLMLGPDTDLPGSQGGLNWEAMPSGLAK